MAQGADNDELRGAKRGSSGSQPRAEVAPDQSGLGGGEALRQALGDQSDLDVAVISVELAADCVAIGFGLHGGGTGRLETGGRDVMGRIQK